MTTVDVQVTLTVEAGAIESALTTVSWWLSRANMVVQLPVTDCRIDSATVNHRASPDVREADTPSWKMHAEHRMRLLTEARAERDKAKADLDEILTEPGRLSVGDGERIARQYAKRAKAAEVERDKAIQERDAACVEHNAACVERDEAKRDLAKVRDDHDYEKQRADSNYRAYRHYHGRAKLAEAKVARVEEHLADSIGVHVTVNEIRKALDGVE